MTKFECIADFQSFSTSTLIGFRNELEETEIFVDFKPSLTFYRSLSDFDCCFFIEFNFFFLKASFI